MKRCKLFTNNKGAALLYVIMALTVIVAVCISVTLISTSLYTRTAQTASKEQAFLLAKSIGQCFAQEFVEDTNDKLRYQILDYLATNPTGRVSASATMYFDPDNLSASTANKSELNSLRIANAQLSFYLSEDGHYMYGDVTVPYNGVTGTATVVFTYVNRSDLAHNMMDLFSVYNIYSTYPDKLSFNFAKSGKVGSVYPNVYVYNGTDSGVETASYTLSDNVDANLTANGDIRINSKSSADVKYIQGKLTGYGAVTLGSVVIKGGLYVNGALTVGSSTNYTTVGYDLGTRVNCDIYALNDVTVYGRKSGSDFPKMISGNIIAEGDVVLYNANVGGVIRSSGSVTLVNSYCSGVICSGSVVIKSNSTVDGAVQAGSLTVIDSSVTGNVTVKSSTSGVVTTGDLIVRQTSSATADHKIGSSASSTIQVAGNAAFANDSSSKSLTVYGKVYVAGGVNSPFSISERTTTNYPFQTTIVGSLTIMGGIKYQRQLAGDVRAHTYLVNYLTGLKVSKSSAGDLNSGHVTCYWSIPVFCKPNQDVMGNGATATVTQSMADNQRTVIEGSLYVATKAGGYGQAGNFAYMDAQTTATNFFSEEWAPKDTVVDAAYQPYVNLNGAVLNNVFVGSSSTPGSIAVWNGSISGVVIAHDIKLSYVQLASTTNLTAKSVAVGGIAEPGNLAIHSISNSTLSASYATTVAGSLSASGRLAIRNGVTLAEGSTARALGSVWLSGVIKGEVIMDRASASTETNTMTIDRTADLVATSDGLAIHANGNLLVRATSGTTRTKPVYLSGNGALYGQMGTIYLTPSGRITTGESYCTIRYATDSALDPYADEVTINEVSSDGKAHLSSLINVNPDSTVCIVVDTIVHGNVNLAGGIRVIASLTVEGDLKVDRLLNDINKNYHVAGNMEVTRSLTSLWLEDSTVGGNFKTYATDSVHLGQCEIGGSVWAENSAFLELNDAVVGAGDTINNTAFVKAHHIHQLIDSVIYGYILCDKIKYNVNTTVMVDPAPAGATGTVEDIPAPTLDGSTGEIKKYDSDGFSLPQYVNLSLYNPTISAITPFTGGQLARLTLGNATYWGVRAVPLRWVTPNKTVGGELVSLRNTGTTTSANTMSVKYDAMASKASLPSVGTIFDGIWDRFKKLNWSGIGDWVSECAGKYSTFLSESTKPVTSWAGLGFANQTDATYYRVSADYSKLNSRRSGADVLVVSRPLGTRTAYDDAPGWIQDVIGWHLFDWYPAGWVGDALKGIVTEYSYRPVGVFFYESGYVPEGVFWSYKSQPTSRSQAASNYNGNSASEYRTASNKQNEMDSEYRWIWGGTTGAITSTMGDCTWTFFTCTDPSNPYGSAAKDLHIILPKHTYMLWAKDSNSAVNIIGNGRVFLYLQEDTNIKVVGNGMVDWLHQSWDTSAVGNWFNGLTGGGKKSYTVFGGVRAVGVDPATGETVYNYDKSGNPTGVKYMDAAAVNTGHYQLQPRMYIIGTGPNITFEVEDFQTAAYVYMPTGYSQENARNYPYYICPSCGARKGSLSGRCSRCGTTATGSTAYGLNTFIVSTSERSSSQQSDVYGIYVADRFVYNTSQNAPISYVKTVPDLSNTILYYKSTRVSYKRSGYDSNGALITGMYELSEFWDYPKDLPVSNMTWTYRGLTVQ